MNTDIDQRVYNHSIKSIANLQSSTPSTPTPTPTPTPSSQDVPPEVDLSPSMESQAAEAERLMSDKV
jgi:hypothetical protein